MKNKKRKKIMSLAALLAQAMAKDPTSHCDVLSAEIFEGFESAGESDDEGQSSSTSSSSSSTSSSSSFDAEKYNSRKLKSSERKTMLRVSVRFCAERKRWSGMQRTATIGIAQTLMCTQLKRLQNFARIVFLKARLCGEKSFSHK